LNSLDPSDTASVDFSSHNHSKSELHKSNKQQQQQQHTLSLFNIIKRAQIKDNVVTRSHKSPQKSEKNNINNNFSAHRKLLFSPGRSPNTVNNVGYLSHYNANLN